MKKQSKVQFYKGLPPEGALAKWFKPQHHGILILDDLMKESGKDKRVFFFFHHRGITALYLIQDLFPPRKFAKTINRNAIMPFALKVRGINQLSEICCFKSTLTSGKIALNYF